ncbi:MAG: hypothetical protein KDK76_04710 [Chlamydiia bacterium]|nr:hypothetical protein [Chlamydiia bacterium]
MNILIVKSSSLGDILQTFPVVTFLKKRFPHARIDWVVEKPYEELLTAHPDVYEVFPVVFRKWRKNIFKYRKEMRCAIQKVREKKYDLLFDLQGNIKSALVTKCARSKEKIGTTFSAAPEWPNALVLNRRYGVNPKEPISFQYLSLVQSHFGVKPHPVMASPLLQISGEEKDWIESQLVKGTSYMVCPGSNWENKKLFLPTWIELLKEVQKRKNPHFYFVWGSLREKEEALALHTQFPKNSTLLPQMSLPLWQRFMARMDGIFTVDSSALHLAATTPVPTYSFFGPSNASVYKPPFSHHHAFQGTCPYGQTFLKRCPVLRTCKTGACLKEPLPSEFMKVFI